MKRAFLWLRERNGIRCELCARKCFITNGKSGYCLVRVNKNNVLYTLNYGKLYSLKVEPIEKNPLYHFYPGSKTFSLAASGCNIRSKFCCDWDIGQEVRGENYSPQEVVKLAEKKGCSIITYKQDEPTIFLEFVYETAKEAHKEAIMNTFVTNGYMSLEAVKKISKYLDAVTVNIKASADPEFYKKFMDVPSVKPIFTTLKQFHKRRIFIEVTNLIIPKIGDDLSLCEKLTEWINTELGSDVPLHILRFHPTEAIRDIPPTPLDVLEKALAVAKEAGLRYVYIGNVPGHKNESTYCYNCGELLIERLGQEIRKINLNGDRCPNCSLKINLVSEFK
jgi:pyruvate formate lyase activating enzyme